MDDDIAARSARLWHRAWDACMAAERLFERAERTLSPSRVNREPKHRGRHRTPRHGVASQSGGRGIRTHDGCYPIAVFKTAAIGH